MTPAFDRTLLIGNPTSGGGKVARWLDKVAAAVRGTGSGIANLAHLGGILFGLLYFNYYRIGKRLRLMYLKFKYRNMGGGPRDSDEDRWDGWGRA